jgi:hypothetical protein
MVRSQRPFAQQLMALRLDCYCDRDYLSCPRRRRRRMGERLKVRLPKLDRLIRRRHRYCSERAKELEPVHLHHHEWSSHLRLVPELVQLRRRLSLSRPPLEQAQDLVQIHCQDPLRLSVLVLVRAIRYAPWKAQAWEKDSDSDWPTDGQMGLDSGLDAEPELGSDAALATATDAERAWAPDEEPVSVKGAG